MVNEFLFIWNRLRRCCLNRSFDSLRSAQDDSVGERGLIVFVGLLARCLRSGCCLGFYAINRGFGAFLG